MTSPGKARLESLFGTEYIQRAIKGTLDVRLSKPEVGKRLADYIDEGAKELAREHLLRLLKLKRMHNEQWNKLVDERLSTFEVPIAVALRPTLSKAILRITDGVTNNKLDWNTINRAYEIYKNAATHAYKFDPVVATQGTMVGDNYNIDHFVGASPNNCAEMEDMSYTTRDNGMRATDGSSVLDSNGDVVPFPTQMPIDMVSDLASRDMFMDIIRALGKMLLYFYYSTAANYFNRFRNIPIIKNFVRKLVRTINRLAAKALCEMNGGTEDSCAASAGAQYPDDVYDPNDDEDFDLEDFDITLIGLKGINSQFTKDRDPANLECLQAASIITRFVQLTAGTATSRSPIAPDESTEVDWNAVIMALILKDSRDELEGHSQLLLSDTPLLGDLTEALDNDTTVGDAVDELHADSQTYPVYRMRYYGSSKERWTQITNP